MMASTLPVDHVNELIPVDLAQLPGFVVSHSEQLYLDSGNKMKVLYILCIGLQNDGVPVFVLDVPPWSLLKKLTISSKNSDYVAEVERRASIFNTSPMPRPQNWSRKQTITWLKQNPVHQREDVFFLVEAVEDLRKLVEEAHCLETNPHNETAGVASGAWRGVVPYMRVIMCLAEDEVKMLFLIRADCQTRQQLDAQNSESR
jgi:hypothetical protein